jgi:hypothetical protein
MSDQQLKQRIAYLVEHGGIAEDPLADIKHQIRFLFVLAAVGCSIGLAALLVLIR